MFAIIVTEGGCPEPVLTLLGNDTQDPEALIEQVEAEVGKRGQYNVVLAPIDARSQDLDQWVLRNKHPYHVEKLIAERWPQPS